MLASPVPLQMWPGRALPVPAPMWAGATPVRVQISWGRHVAVPFHECRGKPSPGADVAENPGPAIPSLREWTSDASVGRWCVVRASPFKDSGLLWIRVAKAGANEGKAFQATACIYPQMPTSRSHLRNSLILTGAGPSPHLP